MTSALKLILLGGNPLPITANLAAWYAADKGITIATGVSAWADQSGNGNTLAQATTTKQPVFSAGGGPKGLSALNFDGVDDLLVTGAMAGLVAPVSYYFLFKQITWTLGDRIFDGAAVNTGTLLQADGTLGGAVSPNFQSAACGPITTLPLGTWGVATFILNGASSLIRLNLGTAFTGTETATSPLGLTLAADGGNAFALNSNIGVSEWLVYNGAHSTTQQNATIQYLMRKAGL